MNIQDAAKEKILVLDGAMGTMIQQYDLSEEDFRGEEFSNHSMPLKGNNDFLSLTRPDIIKEIHRKYLEAGSDIVETNTFCSTSIAQSDYGMESIVYRMNFESAKIAREVCDQVEKETGVPRFVAGSVGPTNKSASISPNVEDPGFRAVDFDELVGVYGEQIKGLVEGGADVILIETVFDTLNAKAGLFACVNVFKEINKSIPVMVSGTITDSSGRTLSGQTTEAFAISLEHFPLFSLGLNCALGAKELRPYLSTLNKVSSSRVSAHPNAGLPNEFGEYDQSPENMVEQIKTFLDEGMLNIVGGCCGTTPDHIKAIAELAVQYKPRMIQA